ncbi:unnamed protein product [Acanthosepion pharaonis]|uniref:Uncharacterized protein n=1 Tax=Acanthosepion pharaonis TaxID=158019 RepID=A0A812D4Z3_ACAPH|nr:unnamed protein product [Sepia pharaonis]
MDSQLCNPLMFSNFVSRVSQWLHNIAGSEISQKYSLSLYTAVAKICESELLVLITVTTTIAFKTSWSNFSSPPLHCHLSTLIFSIFFFCFYCSLFLSLPFFSVLLLTFLFVFWGFFSLLSLPPCLSLWSLKIILSAISLLIYNFMLSLSLFIIVFSFLVISLSATLSSLLILFFKISILSILSYTLMTVIPTLSLSLSLLFQFFSVLSFLFFFSL